MKQQFFLASLMATPWAMHPEVLHAYARLLARSYGDAGADGQEGGPQIGALAAAARAARPSAGKNIAVLGLYGPIMQRAGLMDMCTGGTSTQAFTQQLRAAVSDETVMQILVDIDSPGGSVAGVSELAAEIRAARGTKPIIGIANSMAASAAYWIGSACSELYCTPSGQVGSIGVITAHEDMSEAFAKEGVKTTLITAGKFKAEGNPFGPLDDDALRTTQAMIDSYYADFTGAIAKGRGVPIDSVRSDMGQGRMMRGDAAQAAGMIDGVATFDDVVAKMQRSAAPRRSALSAARQDLGLIG